MASITPRSEHLIENLTFQNGDVVLRALAAGPPDGPVVLLLHGFPEFSYGWRKQIGPLAAAGFRVIAPDGRGYNQNSKPAGVDRYSITHLVSDVVAIIGHLGGCRVALVGHDWGAVVAWCTAAWHGDLLTRLAILNVPHPALMLRFLLTRPRQLFRSWYILFFQTPLLPELFFSANNYKAAAGSLVKTSRPGTFTDEDLARYREAWQQPGAVKAMIDWYRALLRYPEAFRADRIEVPALILWGTHDAFLLPSLAAASLGYCTQAELIRFHDATHWLHLEQSERVNAELIRFLNVQPAGNSQASVSAASPSPSPA